VATADEIVIDTPSIRLSQLLKLAGMVDSGGEVRSILVAGRVAVNGTVEVRRGRQLRHGDLVELGGRRVRVIGTRPVAAGSTD
jgi:ribosome-associated protein